MSDTFLIKRPLVTERAVDLQSIGKYVFVVKTAATKQEIKKAIKDIYKVSVVAVNIVNRPEKMKRFRGIKNRRPGYKKAIVTLKDGDKIDLGR